MPVPIGPEERPGWVALRWMMGLQLVSMAMLNRLIRNLGKDVEVGRPMIAYNKDQFLRHVIKEMVPDQQQGTRSSAWVNSVDVRLSILCSTTTELPQISASTV